MTRIGYHCSHEQFDPAQLRDLVALAENSGFSCALSSDHLAPWSLRQGQSGQAWAWLGAALQATQRMRFGCLAIPCGWRYHPALVAQAFATLAALFPKRLPWIAAGSGEALNEAAIGQGWPPKTERQTRLKAGVDMMRALWRGEEVEAQTPIPADKARLWCLPESPPRIYAAALTAETAAWAATWADGLITVRNSPEKTGGIIQAFRANGGLGKPLVLQYQLSWAAQEDEALRQAHDQWRHAACDLPYADIASPQEFDRLSEDVQPQDMAKAMMVSSSPALLAEDIRRYAGLGFDEIYLHNAGRNQKEFIACFREKILPLL